MCDRPRRDSLVPPAHMDKLFAAASKRSVKLVSGASDINISTFSISKSMYQVANGDHNDTWEIGGKGYAMAVAKFVANCTGTDNLVDN